MQVTSKAACPFQRRRRMNFACLFLVLHSLSAVLVRSRIQCFISYLNQSFAHSESLAAKTVTHAGATPCFMVASLRSLMDPARHVTKQKGRLQVLHTFSPEQHAVIY